MSIADFFIFGRSVPWFYWIAPIVMLSAVFMILTTGGGYIKKVLFPKYRGRRVEE